MERTGENGVWSVDTTGANGEKWPYMPILRIAIWVCVCVCQFPSQRTDDSFSLRGIGTAFPEPETYWIGSACWLAISPHAYMQMALLGQHTHTHNLFANGTSLSARLIRLTVSILGAFACVNCFGNGTKPYTYKHPTQQLRVNRQYVSRNVCTRTTLHNVCEINTNVV